MAKALIVLLLSLQGALFNAPSPHTCQLRLKPTNHITPLPTGEGLGVGLFIRHINTLPYNVHVKSASHGKPYQFAVEFIVAVGLQCAALGSE